MKVKTTELIGPALDYAVFIARGMSYWTISGANWDTNHGYTDWVLSSKGVLETHMFDGSRSRAGHWEVDRTYNPSTDDAWAGPIIDEMEIGTKRNAPCSPGCEWEASPSITAKGAGGKWGYGPTRKIAAMRCFVASKLGDEIELPKEFK